MKAIISFRSMHISLRFVLPLVFALSILAYLSVPLVDKLTLRWFVRDLDIRSQLVASTLQESLAELAQNDDSRRINNLLQSATRDERLFALGFCDQGGKLKYRSSTFPATVNCKQILDNKGSSKLLQLPQGLLHVAVSNVYKDETALGTLILLHDMSFIERRSADTRKYIIAMFLVLGIVISLITVLVAHLSWRGWVDGVRAMLRGEGILRPFAQPASSELQPLVGDLRSLLRSLDAERRIADDATIT